MARNLFIAIAAACVLLIIAGAYAYYRLSSVADTAWETALAEAQSDTLTVAGIAGAIIGEQLLDELALTPEQHRRIARLYEEERRARHEPSAGDSTIHGTPAALSAGAAHELSEFRRRNTRDSLLAVFTEQQRRKRDELRSARNLVSHGWERYARTPLAQGLLADLDLTDAQKGRMNVLATRYGPRFAALLIEADPAARQTRMRLLFDEAWVEARTVLTPTQQARLEQYLATHRSQLQAGLHGAWLQGL